MSASLQHDVSDALVDGGVSSSVVDPAGGVGAGDGGSVRGVGAGAASGGTGRVGGEGAGAVAQGVAPVPGAEAAGAIVDAAPGKVRTQVTSTAVLAVMAGAFIAFGAVVATVVSTTGTGGATDAVVLPYGVTRALTGTVFSVGLVLVVLAGARLFTGDTQLALGWVRGRIKLRELLGSWALVYVGNLVGSLVVAGLVFAAGQYTAAGGQVGRTALTIAEQKGSLGFVQAFALGVLCNALVCLAVWMTTQARSTVDKVAVIVPPIATFVAAGFEHCVANMYFLPVAVLVRDFAPASFWAGLGTTAAAYPHVTWLHVLGNLVPVTLGNLVGGLAVWAGYGHVWLRRGSRG